MLESIQYLLYNACIMKLLRYTIYSILVQQLCAIVCKIKLFGIVFTVLQQDIVRLNHR